MSAVSTPTPAILDVLPDAIGPAPTAAPAIRDNLPDAQAAPATAASAPAGPAVAASAPADPAAAFAPAEPVAAASAEPVAAASAKPAAAANSVLEIKVGNDRLAEMSLLRARELLVIAGVQASNGLERRAKGYASIALLAECNAVWVSKQDHLYATLGGGVRRVCDGTQVATADEVARAIEAQQARDAQKRAEAAAQKVAASAEKIAAAVATIVAEAANLPPVAAADADAAMMAAWRGLVRDKAGPSRGTAVAALEAAVLVARAEPRA